MGVELSLLVTSLIASMFFSGVETAMLGVGALNLVRGSRKKMYHLYTNKEKIVTTCLIGNNISIVGATILIDNLFLASGDLRTTILALSTEVIVFFLLAEAFPKIISQRLGITMLESLYYPINFFNYLFSPITFIFLSLTNYLFKFVSTPHTSRREDIFYFLSSHMRGQSIVRSLMDMNSTTVKEIMTPLNKIYSISKDATVKEALILLEETSYTRFPIYEKRSDHVIGYIHISDILTAHKHDKIINFLKKTEYVSEFLFVDKLLLQMQENQLSMVFVVSEFGSVIGLVTLEDVGENLVGDIHIEEQPQLENIKINKKDKNEFTLSGGLDIDDFNQYFRLNIKKDGFETLSGFLMKTTMNIPKPGDEFRFDFGTIKVSEGDGKSIKKLQFSKKRLKTSSKPAA